MTLTLELPEKVLKKLEDRVEKEGADTECIVMDAITAYLGLDDPETKAEVYLKLSEKYLREADEFLTKEDVVQASEKGWGAAAQAVKASAARKGLELHSHGELHKFVARLSTETGDEETRRLWQSAVALHQNFYENWLPEEMVAGNIKDVKKLLRKLGS